MEVIAGDKLSKWWFTVADGTHLRFVRMRKDRIERFVSCEDGSFVAESASKSCTRVIAATLTVW